MHKQNYAFCWNYRHLFVVFENIFQCLVNNIFDCYFDRKKIVDDHRQKYVEITKNCLGIEIADERLRFLQTKHLQCVLPVWTVFTPQNYFQVEFEYTLSEQFLLYSYNMKSLRKSYTMQSACAVFTLDFLSNVIGHFRLETTRQSTSYLSSNYFVQ